MTTPAPLLAGKIPFDFARVIERLRRRQQAAIIAGNTLRATELAHLIAELVAESRRG